MIYEALVKFDTNKNDSLSPQDQERILFQQGDIVVIRPRGWQWGRLEKKEFLIILVDIPEADVDFYASPLLGGGRVGPGGGCQRRFAVDVKSLLQTLSTKEVEKVLDKTIDFQPFCRRICPIIDKLQLEI